MTIYHTSPRTGKAARCRAYDACPYGATFGTSILKDGTTAFGTASPTWRDMKERPQRGEERIVVDPNGEVKNVWNVENRKLRSASLVEEPVQKPSPTLKKEKGVQLPPEAFPDEFGKDENDVNSIDFGTDVHDGNSIHRASTSTAAETVEESVVEENDIVEEEDEEEYEIENIRVNGFDLDMRNGYPVNQESGYYERTQSFENTNDVTVYTKLYDPNTKYYTAPVSENEEEMERIIYEHSENPLIFTLLPREDAQREADRMASEIVPTLNEQRYNNSGAMNDNEVETLLSEMEDLDEQVSDLDIESFMDDTDEDEQYDNNGTTALNLRISEIQSEIAEKNQNSVIWKKPLSEKAISSALMDIWKRDNL